MSGLAAARKRKPNVRKDLDSWEQISPTSGEVCDRCLVYERRIQSWAEWIRTLCDQNKNLIQHLEAYKERCKLLEEMLLVGSDSEAIHFAPSTPES